MLMKEYSESEPAEESAARKDPEDMYRIYESADAAESNLESFITDHAYLIEEGLVCLDHSFCPDGRMNALFSDSGNSLVVAEIKIGDSSDMVFHCMDYYDRIMQNLHDYARMLDGSGESRVETTRRPRMMLISQEFSRETLERLKWLSIDVSVFQVKCIKTRDSNKMLPVFFKVSIPETPELAESFAPEKPSYEKEKRVPKLDIYFGSVQESMSDESDAGTEADEEKYDDDSD